MNYLRFILDNRHFLAFGFLLAGLSSYGQTFLLSLFGGHIRDEFGLSNAAFGGVYSSATLISGLCLFWLGQQLDRLDLRLFSALVLIGACVGSLLLASAQSLLWLGVAFLLLRACGQGLMMHTAQTSMARYFDAGRGKALSVATLGLPVGEALFPAVAVAGMAGMGWRGTWLWMGGALLVLVLPAVLWLLRDHQARHDAWLERRRQVATQGSERHWRRRDVVRDPRLYLVLPAVLTPPFAMTALFFHQVPLAAEKGWALAWLAQAFVLYAVAHVAALLAVGPFVDRLGARRLLPFYLVPLAAALLTLGTLSGDYAALIYMGCAGLNMGLAGTIFGAIWAELYGVTHLGAIRSMAQALMVLSTALAPFLVGVILDAGAAVSGVAFGLLAWVVLVSLLAWVGVRQS